MMMMTLSSTIFAAAYSFPLLLLLAFGPSAVFAVAADSAGKIIEEVKQFKEEFGQEIEPFKLRQNGGLAWFPMEMESVPTEIEIWKINKQYFEYNFFFEPAFNNWLDDVHKRLRDFFRTKMHSNAVVIREKMDAVHEVLDKMEIDQQLLDRLDLELYRYIPPPPSPHAPQPQRIPPTEEPDDKLIKRGKNISTSHVKYHQWQTILLSKLTLHSITYGYIKTQMQRLYELRKKCNAFVRQTREQLWLRQPLDTYARLRELMLEDGKMFREKQILPFVDQIAKETDIYTLIPGYVKEEKARYTKVIKSHYKIKKPSSAFAMELTNNQLPQKMDLFNNSLERLNVVVRQNNAVVDEVCARIGEKIREYFKGKSERDGKLSESHFDMLTHYDLVNAVSLILHRKLQRLAHELGGGHYHKILLMARHDDDDDNIDEEEKKKKKKEEEAEFFKKRDRQVFSLWLLANYWLGRTLHFSSGISTEGKINEMLQWIKDEWEMPAELDVEVRLLAHVPDHDVRKRIFACGLHLMFLYEQLNKLYDFDTMIINGATTLDPHATNRELKELIEKEALLTPMGAVFYKNAWKPSNSRSNMDGPD